jgi:hypothetical protein
MPGDQFGDPVEMEIDENGTLYVVDMPGYPLDKSGSGKIKILSDTDGDPNSIYTRKLLPLLKQPGLQLPVVAQRVDPPVSIVVPQKTPHDASRSLPCKFLFSRARLCLYFPNPSPRFAWPERLRARGD